MQYLSSQTLSISFVASKIFPTDRLELKDKYCEADWIPHNLSSKVSSQD